MKQCLYLILLLAAVTLSGMAQSVGDAFYIYRNDGKFNAFFRDEVDSITYSHYDADSVYYDEMVTQLVHTQDSVYFIPLAAIDSVGFVQPETKYKQGVKRLERDLLDYVIGADGLTLKLKPETPAAIIPVKGDKLVLLDGCSSLPYGFSGIVSDVQTGSSAIDVVCTQAYLEDLFDSFCSVSTVYGANPNDDASARVLSGNNRRRATYNPSDVVFSLGPYTVNRSYDVSQGIAHDGDLALDLAASYSVEIQPTLKIHTFLILGEGHGTYFSYRISGDLRVSSQSSLSGGLSYNHDFDGIVASCPIPMTGNMVNFYINPGLFIRSDATIAGSVTSTQNYTFGSAFDFSSKGQNVIKPSVGGRLAGSSVEMSGSLDGSLAGGAYVEMGFNLLSRDIAKVCVRGEMGARLSGNFVFRNSDMEKASKETKLYERLKASNVQLSSFANLSLQASVAHIGNGLTWELSEPIHTWNLVPEFSNTKLTKTSGLQTSADAYTELRGDCLFPVSVGYKLFDEDMNEVSNYDATTNYTNQASKIEHTFSGLEEDKLYRYNVYPKLKLFGFDVLASPSAKIEGEHFCPDSNHPHRIDLGLPSGTQWRCCNIGADSPEGYGDYFAWGETSPKSVYDWSTYKYCKGSSYTMTKYCTDSSIGTVDNKTVLEAVDDAATANWGSNWRMPTYEEQRELIEKCTWTWTTSNGVNGYKVVGPNGNSIFLPAAGVRGDSSVLSTGSSGYYLAASLSEGYPDHAWYLNFHSGRRGSYNIYRFAGLSVRAVARKN